MPHSSQGLQEPGPEAPSLVGLLLIFEILLESGKDRLHQFLDQWFLVSQLVRGSQLFQLLLQL